MKIKQILTLSVLSMGIFFAACKKDPVTVEPTPPTEPVILGNGQRAELTKDSIFLYAKEIYLWNDKLPTYEVFNPRKFTSYTADLDNYDQELFEIAKYSSPYEYKTGATYPKYSYIFDQGDKNPTASVAATASVDLEGNGNDLGIRFGYYGSNNSYIIYATAVYQNSPADKAGFKRGDVISKINGASYGTNFPSEINSISAAVSANTVSLQGVRGNGTSYTVSLSKAVFKSSPIYKSTVIATGGKKVGYVAYARFSNAENSITELNTIFDGFASSGVTDLVVDLRYNGGGYVSTAEHLANLIAPSTASGVMFTEYFNATMQAGNAKILTHQPLLDGNGRLQYQDGKMVTYADIDYTPGENTTRFAKKGALTSVRNVVFIVTGSTASASELVINSLKPYMTVKLVGQTSYGKPVGFFPITLENKYDVYFSLFETKNSLGQGSYYDGFTPDVDVKEVPAGTIMYDFGNVNDYYLKQALGLLVSSPVNTSQSVATMSVQQRNNLPKVSSSNEIETDLNDKEFLGMIENRLKTRK